MPRDRHIQRLSAQEFSRLLTEQLLYRVNKPGQYLGNEWGAIRRSFDSAEVRLCLAFPDIYELGMSNFGQRILYQIVNGKPQFMADRTYAPEKDMEELLRLGHLPLWGFESRRPIDEFELIGFSLQYELTYTNVLNMLDMSGIPLEADKRSSIFPLVFAGGPSCVNPEPMARFFDFFMIGDGEQAIPEIMEVVRAFKREHDMARGSAASDTTHGAQESGARAAESGLQPGAEGQARSMATAKQCAAPNTKAELRRRLLIKLAGVAGVYVPALYEKSDAEVVAKPTIAGIPERVPRQIMPLNDDNQPAGGLVPYLNLVHDRQVLEVRRGCDRGCRFCQPGYTFLPVRERSADELVRVSKEALAKSGYQEYSLLSLCVSDYTSLHEAVRALNREHMGKRASMSFPSQRADRMNFEIAEELKAVRKSGITLAPEAGSERLRAVINKGLSHQQIIDAITTAYRSGWSSVKLYYMIGLPTERDEDLQGIIDTLKEATARCFEIRREDREKYKSIIEFTCTMSSFVPKPFTPFQWFGQCTRKEFARKQAIMRDMLRASGLKNVQLNFTQTETSLLEAVISRGDRKIGDLILRAWQKGCTFDAWDDRLKPALWHESAAELALDLERLASDDREVGSAQPWDVVNVGLADWWLVNEWKKALATKETAPCSENTCHACGVCTDLSATHVLANPSEVVLGKNPFVKKLSDVRAQAAKEPAAADGNADRETHPSLFFEAPPAPESNRTLTKLIFEFKKTGELRFIGHLDLQHLFVRAARRADIHTAHTEGFNPQPKLSLALSLALYCEGLAELAEIELCQIISAEDFVRRMNAQLPPEVQIGRCRIADPGKTALAPRIGRATYRAMLRSPNVEAARVKERVSSLLAEPKLEVAMTASLKSRKKGKRPQAGSNDLNGLGSESSQPMKDIKLGIYSLQVVDDSPTIQMELAHGSKMHIKPSDILALVEPGGEWRLTRVCLSAENGASLFDAERTAPGAHAACGNAS